jgi:bifunctional non-homologous end joining protein LigD
VQPIIPISRKEPFDDPACLFEFKYDGFRALCYIEQRRCRFVSRNGNTMAHFDALGDQVAAELELDDAILDGEAIAADETGRPQFYVLLRRTRRPAYVAFDLLWLKRCRPARSAAPRAPAALGGHHSETILGHL